MTEEPKIEYGGLHHLALVCADMERTVDFYTNVLDMTLKKGFDLAGYGQHFFFDMGGGNDLAFFWFKDAAKAQPGIASAAHLTGRRDEGTITSAHGSMNHVAFNIAPDKIDAYRDKLVARGVDCTPIVNHEDVITGQESRTSSETTAKTWLRSFYFFDPDGIMLEFCATLNAGEAAIDLPVNAEGIKADGSGITPA